MKNIEPKFLLIVILLLFFLGSCKCKSSKFFSSHNTDSIYTYNSEEIETIRTPVVMMRGDTILNTKYYLVESFVFDSNQKLFPLIQAYWSHPHDDFFGMEYQWYYAQLQDYSLSDSIKYILKPAYMEKNYSIVYFVTFNSDSVTEYGYIPPFAKYVQDSLNVINYEDLKSNFNDSKHKNVVDQYFAICKQRTYRLYFSIDNDTQSILIKRY